MNILEDESLQASLISIGIGISFLYGALRQNRLIQKIKDIPTSKIDNAHIGDFVEVKGKVFCNDIDITIAPISKKECSFYIWEIQLHSENDKWNTIERILSDDYFYIKDDGQYLAAVKLVDCEMLEDTVDKIYNFKASELTTLPNEIRDILQKNSKEINISENIGWSILSNRYRIRERIFNKGLELYVLGSTFSPARKKMFNRKNLSVDEEKSLVKDTYKEYQEVMRLNERQRKYDTDRNGKLDISEKNKLYADLEEQNLKRNNPLNANYYKENVKFVYEKSENDKAVFGLSHIQLSTKKENTVIGMIKIKYYLKLSAGVIWVLLGLFIIIIFKKVESGQN